jgi:hypothetical protein
MERYAAYQIGISSRILNANECRSLEDLNPYQGGDAYENPNTISSGIDKKGGGTKGGKNEPEL